ncbi:MAG: hypothetical protein ACPGVC_10005 [Salibacteraceae bacterium]
MKQLRLVNIILFLFILFSPITTIGQEDIEFFRSKFQNAKNESDFQKILHTQIAEKDTSNINKILAYKAVSHSAMAQYVFNPYTKYKIFFEGKDELEELIEKDPSCENIFLRLVVQLKIPEFLGYSKDVEHDLNYLYTHLEKEQIPIQTKMFIVKTITDIESKKYNLDSLSLLKFTESKTHG